VTSPKLPLALEKEFRLVQVVMKENVNRSLYKRRLLSSRPLANRTSLTQDLEAPVQIGLSVF